jgi:hypothetical protein
MVDAWQIIASGKGDRRCMRWHSDRHRAAGSLAALDGNGLRVLSHLREYPLHGEAISVEPHDTVLKTLGIHLPIRNGRWFMSGL